MEKCFRGEGFIATVQFIERRYDPPTRDKIYDSLSPQVRQQLNSFQKNEWYSRDYADEIWRAASETQEDQQKKYNELVAVGRAIGEGATNTFLRLLVKLLTPAVFARKFPDFWARYHNYGVCDADVSGVNENRIIITLRETDNFPTLGGVGAGWIYSAFEAMGKKNVRVVEKNAPNIVAVPEIPYTVTWT